MMTPQQAGDRLVVIRTQIAAIDAQAAALVPKLIAGRQQLKDLAAQRQPLIDEVEAMLRETGPAPWRDTLRASGDTSSP